MPSGASWSAHGRDHGHGIHLHEVGGCDPFGALAFESDGAIVNPAMRVHGGTPAEQQRHVGDVGILFVQSQALLSLCLIRAVP